MTDKAPERIWVSETDLGERWWQEADYEPATEYVLADLLKAAVAAENEEIAKHVDTFLMVKTGTPIEKVVACVEAIRARTDADAIAALEQVKREAYERGVREAAEVASLAPFKRNAMVCGCSDGLSNFTHDAILALLDKEPGQ